MTGIFSASFNQVFNELAGLFRAFDLLEECLEFDAGGFIASLPYQICKSALQIFDEMQGEFFELVWLTDRPSGHQVVDFNGNQRFFVNFPGGYWRDRDVRDIPAKKITRILRSIRIFTGNAPVLKGFDARIGSVSGGIGAE